MDLGTVLAALSPFAVYIAVGLILLLLVAEARGSWRRMGTTSHRSSLGALGTLVVLALLGLFLVAAGWTWLGGLVLAGVLLALIVWASSASSRRRGR
jgi:O-antigen ligase